MRHPIRTLTLVAPFLVMAAPLAAQTVPTVLPKDSLTADKKALRDVVAELRDTLNVVQSMHARIVRATNSGMTAVALSQGRQLVRSCGAGAAATELTSRRVAPMRTNDPRGEQALSAYRAGLTALATDLRSCEHDDSMAVAAPKVDPAHIEAIARAADDAIRRCDTLRDALLRLLDIDLPIHGKMWTGS